MTEHLRTSDAITHQYYDGVVVVEEFHFTSDTTINDARIILTGRYPATDYAVNDTSTVLISVEDGEGFITIQDAAPLLLSVGDRLLVKPGEPYFFSVDDTLIIRYIATPAWTPAQARIVE